MYVKQRKEDERRMSSKEELKQRFEQTFADAGDDMDSDNVEQSENSKL